MQPKTHEHHSYTSCSQFSLQYLRRNGLESQLQTKSLPEMDFYEDYNFIIGYDLAHMGNMAHKSLLELHLK